MVNNYPTDQKYKKEQQATLSTYTLHIIFSQEQFIHQPPTYTKSQPFKQENGTEYEERTY